MGKGAEPIIAPKKVRLICDAAAQGIWECQ